MWGAPGGHRALHTKRCPVSVCLCSTHVCAQRLLADTDPVTVDRLQPSTSRHLNLGLHLIEKTKTGSLN